MPETPQEAYDRGTVAGEIAARLAGHDQHFAAINGHLADLAQELHSLTLAVQRLGDQADASAATVLATASALKAADEARRDKTEQSWSPFARIVAALSGLAAIAAVIGVYLAFRR
jgi:hypothetical protein